MMDENNFIINNYISNTSNSGLTLEKTGLVLEKTI